MRIEWLGEASALVVVGENADDAAAERVRHVADALRAKRLTGVTDIVPSYCTIGVHFDLALLGVEARQKVHAWIQERAAKRGGELKGPRRQVTIPVCYSSAFAPDLPNLAATCELSVDDVIQLHTAGRYEVRAVGFMPGFAYLAGMAQRLAAPRHPTPRTRVPAGSVGIAGTQTGVYPLESPGGWQLIGRTPMRMFRPDAKRCSLLQVGDAVRFAPISEREFADHREANP